MVRSFRKQVVDSGIFERSLRQVVQDNHVSLTWIEVMNHRPSRTGCLWRIPPEEPRPTDIIVERLPSIEQPDDYLWNRFGLQSAFIHRNISFKKKVLPLEVGPDTTMVNEWRKRKGFRSIDFPSFPPPPISHPPLLLPLPWIFLWWRSILSLLENSRWQTGHCMSVGFQVQSLPLINSSLSFRKWSRQKTWSIVLQIDFQLIQLIKLRGFCLVVYRSFEGHLRYFLMHDADGLENKRTVP